MGDLQLAVMRFLWTQGGATLGEVRAALEREHGVALTTVATVLTRLRRSGLVSYRKTARGGIYGAQVPEAEIQKVQTGRLVERMFGGRASDLIAHLVRESEIDDKELTRLRRLLSQRDRR